MRDSKSFFFVQHKQFNYQRGFQSLLLARRVCFHLCLTDKQLMVLLPFSSTAPATMISHLAMLLHVAVGHTCEKKLCT